MKPIPLIVAIVGAVGLWWVSSAPLVPDGPEPIPTPQTRLVTLVEPIVAADFTPDDAAAVSEFCLVFADVLDDDAEAKLISDTADLRGRLDQSSRLMFQKTGIGDRHPDVPGQINDILAAWLEIEEDGEVRVVDMDGDGNPRGCAVEAFRAIAWGTGQ